MAGSVHRRMAVNNRFRGWGSTMFFNSSSNMRRRWGSSISRNRCRRRDLCLRGRGWYTCGRRVGNIGQERVLLSGVEGPDQLWPWWRRGCMLDLLTHMFSVSRLIFKVVHSLTKTNRDSGIIISKTTQV